MTGPEKLYHADAAAYVKVAASTWRDYYADGRTPGAVDLGPARREGARRRADGYDIDRGHVRPWWHPTTLDGWGRPGPGARTDLARYNVKTILQLDNPSTDDFTVIETWEE